MTPTPDLQAIRFLEAVRFSLDHERKYPARAMPWTADDMQQLLTLWDTQQTALRTLVEELTHEAVQLPPGHPVRMSLKHYRDELARLLTPEQS